MKDFAKKSGMICMILVMAGIVLKVAGIQLIHTKGEYYEYDYKTKSFYVPTSDISNIECMIDGSVVTVTSTDAGMVYIRCMNIDESCQIEKKGDKITLFAEEVSEMPFPFFYRDINTAFTLNMQIPQRKTRARQIIIEIPKNMKTNLLLSNMPRMEYEHYVELKDLYLRGNIDIRGIIDNIAVERTSANGIRVKTEDEVHFTDVSVQEYVKVQCAVNCTMEDVSGKQANIVCSDSDTLNFEKLQFKNKISIQQSGVLGEWDAKTMVMSHIKTGNLEIQSDTEPFDNWKRTMSLENIEVNELRLNSNFAPADLVNISSKRVICQVTNADITFSNLRSQHIVLNTVLGNIRGSMTGAAAQYTVSGGSVEGRDNLNRYQGSGSNILKVKSQKGDIELEFK